MSKTPTHFFIITVDPEDNLLIFSAGETRIEIPYGDLKEKPLESFVQELSGHLAQYAPIPNTAVLALPDAWCLSSLIELKRWPRRHRAMAMQYVLEENLPIAVEDFVADFIPWGGNGHALGVCCEKERLIRLVRALEQCGIFISYICPMAILAVQALCEESDGTDVFLIKGKVDINLFICEKGKPVSWSLMESDPQHLALHFLVNGMGQKDRLRVATLNVGEAIEKMLRNLPGVEIIRRFSEPMCSKALEASERIVAGKRKPWINLRKGELANTHRYENIKKSFYALTASVLLVLLALNLFFNFRAHQYGKLITDLEKNQIDIYRRIYSNSSIYEKPLDVLSQLQEAYKNESILRGRYQDIPARTSALVKLYAVLSHLPPYLRYRIHEVRIKPERINMEGETRTHGDASALAKALGEDPRIEVDLPRTQGLKSGGVRFVLTASYHPSEGGGRKP